jgi:hypothetical protein
MSSSPGTAGDTPVSAEKMISRWAAARPRGEPGRGSGHRLRRRGQLRAHEAAVPRLARGRSWLRSLFNFGDNNPIRAKAHLSNYGIPRTLPLVLRDARLCGYRCGTNLSAA